jgi:hypothetical protein
MSVLPLVSPLRLGGAVETVIFVVEKFEGEGEVLSVLMSGEITASTAMADRVSAVMQRQLRHQRLGF